MLRSSLFVKTFSTIVVGVVLLSLTFYFFTVPLIEKMTFEREERAGRTFLDNIYLLIKQSHNDLQQWRESAIEAHQRELRNIVRVVVSYLREEKKKIAEGQIEEGTAKVRILENLRNVKYGNNDYIWISDYNSVLISHPDRELQGKDFSEIKDVKNNLIVPPMVDTARQQGEGFYSYWWRRLGEKEPVEKLSYFR
ncbi:MAG: histidine kinase, partial [bacterium]|nr:histidine kinase [bacterium]